MKEVIAIVLSSIVIFGVYKYRVQTANDFSQRQISNASNRAAVASEQAKLRASELKAALQEEERRRYLNEKVKVFIKAKDAKTCMKELHTEVIDNLVVECNKDHYIELTRGEAEKLKELENERL